jgi:hypothetical protein
MVPGQSSKPRKQHSIEMDSFTIPSSQMRPTYQYWFLKMPQVVHTQKTAYAKKLDIPQQKNYNEKLEVMSLQGPTKCKVNCYI